jgi:DNA-binding PadR family transcriptional regulator
MPATDAAHYLPLTPLWFNVLLAAADGPTHGYAVIKEMEERSGGAVSPGAGTVYVALQRLVQEGLLEEVEEGRQDYSDRRVRRHYALTELGREVCRAEAQRLAGEVQAALGKNVLEPGSITLS